jgi:hypothetical protein
MLPRRSTTGSICRSVNMHDTSFRRVRRLRLLLCGLGVVVGAVGALIPATPAVAAPTCADGGECALGDIGPGGGVVFFVKGTGAFSASRYFPDDSYDCVVYGDCFDNTVSVSLSAPDQADLPFDYLEVAPASAEGTAAWSSGQSNVAGATGSAIGSGAANTAAIAAAYPDANAATHALAYTGGGFYDWFLPSFDELALVLIREEVDGAAMGVFGANQWSSTQSDNANARALWFANGQQLWVTKNAGIIGARPVRAFSAAPPPPPTTSAPTTTAPTTTAAPITTTTAAPPTTTEAPTSTTPPPAPPLSEARAAALPEHWLGAPDHATAGRTVEVRGGGFTPGATIDVYLASEPVLIGRAVADAAGSVTVTVTLPRDVSGRHSLVLYDAVADVGLRQPILLDAAELAFTGSRIASGLVLSFVLIGAGLATIPWDRRRAARAACTVRAGEQPG